MDRSETIKLISIVVANDEYGVSRTTKTSREVYCNVSSVSASEFYQGGQAGLKPEYRFTMFAPDYANETIVEYNDVRYSVYRTYKARNDTIELYVERKVGVLHGNYTT
jgi:SPP1 family predicted phage head-tail adaptor